MLTLFGDMTLVSASAIILSFIAYFGLRRQAESRTAVAAGTLSA